MTDILLHWDEMQQAHPLRFTSNTTLDSFPRDSIDTPIDKFLSIEQHLAMTLHVGGCGIRKSARGCCRS